MSLAYSEERTLKSSLMITSGLYPRFCSLLLTQVLRIRLFRIALHALMHAPSNFNIPRDLGRRHVPRSLRLRARSSCPPYPLRKRLIIRASIPDPPYASIAKQEEEHNRSIFFSVSEISGMQCIQFPVKRLADRRP